MPGVTKKLGNEDDIMTFVLTEGTVAVNMDFRTLTKHKGFSTYKKCLSTPKLSHTVHIVGGGTYEDSTRNYYIIRNSHGSGWGYKGYMKLQAVCTLSA